jgi:hypothetical protein
MANARGCQAGWGLTLRAADLPLTVHQSNRILQRLVLVMGTAQERASV